MHAQNETARNILCVFPRYAPSFGTFEYAYPLTDGVTRVHAAARSPGHRGRASEDLESPLRRRKHGPRDVPLISPGPMRSSSAECISSAAGWRTFAKARTPLGKVVVLGGPSVSACPELYPGFDYLHVGELGDATDALIGALGRDVSRGRASRSC